MCRKIIKNFIPEYMLVIIPAAMLADELSVMQGMFCIDIIYGMVLCEMWLM